MVEEDLDKYIRCYETLATDILVDALDKSYPMRFADLKSFMHDISNDVVLDLGSSQGLLLNEITLKSVVAFDISSVFLKATPLEFNPVRGNAEQLPFKDGMFDTIIASDILEHVFHPELVVDEVYRVLKSDGVFYIVVPWKEDISVYEQFKGKYDYCHLRTFDEESVAKTFYKFKIGKMRGSIPKAPVIWKYYTINRVANKTLEIIERITGRQVLPYVHMMIEARK